MCTRVLWNDNDQATLAGRNMDWFQEMGTNLWAMPAGEVRLGLTQGHALEWPVRHGSVVATAHDRATADGMNERGLAAHLLWLGSSEWGERDEAVPGVAVSMWAQVFLDTCATVAECEESMAATPFQVRPVFDAYTGRISTVHLALEDAQGDSAIIEYVGGRPHLRRGRDLTVMTNSPPFDEQRELLATYQGFGGDRPLPGTTEAADRFVRASYYRRHLPPPRDRRHALAELANVLRTSTQPFGVPDPQQPNLANTLWRTMSDLDRRVYYFESRLSPHLIWIRLDDLDLRDGAPAMKLDLAEEPSMDGEVGRIGDVTNQLTPAVPFPFEMP